MVENIDVLKSTLRGFPFFKGLPDEDIDALIDASSLKECSKNQAVFLQAQPANHVFVVISGWVKLSHINNAGEESGIQMFTCGSIIGLRPLFDNGIYTVFATCVTAAQILAIPANVFKKRSRQNPDLLVRSVAALAHNLEAREVSEACSAQKGSSRRLACLLLRLSSSMRGKGGIFKLPYGKAVAAAQLGMDQATFSRALAGLSSFGVVPSGGGEICIDEFSVLATQCCVHCPIMEAQCKGRRL